jgi:hypothetical protein
VSVAAIRVDLQLIADMVDPATRALDVGCGDAWRRASPVT